MSIDNPLILNSDEWSLVNSNPSSKMLRNEVADQFQKLYVVQIAHYNSYPDCSDNVLTRMHTKWMATTQY